MSNVFQARRVNALALRQMAATAHPGNRTHQARWLASVRYLRRRRLWVLDGSAPKWGIAGQGEAA